MEHKRSIEELWDEKWGNLSDFLAHTSFAEKVYTFIKDKDIKSILDLGAGDGKDSIFLAKQGYDVTAMDISSIALKLLQKRAQEEDLDVQILHGSIADIPISEQLFDVIYAHLSIHYFTDKKTRKIVHRLYDMITSGGYLAVRCKSTKDILYGEGEKIEKDVFRRKGRMRHFFSEEYMRDLLVDFRICILAEENAIQQTMGGETNVSSFVYAIVKKER